MQERLRPQAKFLDHGVERAGIAPMAPEYALDIEGRCVEPFRCVHHLRGTNEEEDRIGIDKAADQPGTGDAIDFGSTTRHPQRSALRVFWRQSLGADQQLAVILPGFKSA